MSQPSAPTAFIASTEVASSLDVELLFIPVFGKDDRLEDLPGLDDAVGGEWRRADRSGEFSRKLYGGSAARVVGAGWKPARLYFIGAGDVREADAERVRRVAAACGYAAFTLMPEGSGVLSVEFKVNLLRPAKGENFLARAEVIKAGRTLTVVRADVFALTEDKRTLVATMQGTMMCLVSGE